jgi:alpha-methylacyl-CoA racemase
MGSLTGLRVVELAAIGPAPHAAMYLADHGATVVRVERSGAKPALNDPLLRGRMVVQLDLKSPAGRDELLEMVDQADVLLEGFRPGVLERLGLDPEHCLERNPRLVVARMTGWGQVGSMAQRAGHDINYIALTGALAAVGEADGRPLPPLNLVGDFGGGSMLVVAGILTALVERATSGRGQVVDAAMVDGASLLMQMMWSLKSVGDWTDARASNLLDGGAPYYRTYLCADGEYVAVGAMEPQFFAELVRVLGLDPSSVPAQDDRSSWEAMQVVFSEVFATRTRAEWVTAFDDVDGCVAPVLALSEVPHHPVIRERGTVVELHGVPQAAPAPRLSRSPAGLPRPARQSSVAEVARSWDARPERATRNGG